MAITINKIVLHVLFIALLLIQLSMTTAYAQTIESKSIGVGQLANSNDQTEFSDAGLSAASNDETLHHDLNKIAQLLQGIDQLQAEFEQIKTIKILQQPLKSNGRFIYFSEKGVIWDLQHPYKLSYLLSENRIKQFNGTSITTIDNKQQPIIGVLSKIFAAIFSGNIQVIKHYFSTKPQWLENTWQLTLIPNNKLVGQFINKIHLSGDRYIKKMTFWEIEGDQIEFIFSNYNDEVDIDEFKNYFN